MRQWLQPAVSAVTDLLFPPRCVLCGDECKSRPGEALFCAACNSELSASQLPACLRCANSCSTADLLGFDCGNCRGRKLLFQAARTIGPYQGALREAVLRAKLSSFERLALALGQRLANLIEKSPFEEAPEVVVGVPMHWRARVWKGTNPAATVALAAARGLGLPLASAALICVRPLRRQATLKPPERRKNVRDAFRAWRSAKIAGKRVLLVDDVMTTGATAHEGSRALLEAGAAAVYIAT